MNQTLYVATLSSLNENLVGSATSGEARFVIENGQMSVTIDVDNAPANIVHWQHFHGFKNGDAASCATMAEDTNGDGIIDLMETEAVSGTTMVPFNELPAAMDIPAETYPTADANGSYHYETTIAMDELEGAFADAFDGGEVNLENRVLYIHGVPTDTEIPSTVASLGDIPASTTLPIACGKIVRQ
ncbi:hypothetical protein GO491_08300 [Flavobacteriaceae bacterium Ap0902]|nr:hypothetical protein [Flavobacteriaceae bacterium Ap0902]